MFSSEKNKNIDEIEVNNVYCMNALDGLDMLEDSSVSLFITSPPYNKGDIHHQENNFFEPYSDDRYELEYQKWQKDILNVMCKKLESSGSILYNHKNRITEGIQITPYEWILETELIVKQELIWKNGTPNFDKIRFYPMTERIYWLAKNKDVVINNHEGFTDIFKWKPVGIGNEHKRSFPLKMVEDMLSVFLNVSLVVDPFSGSGTTAVACKKNDINYICFENNIEYVNSSLERIKKTKKIKKENLKIRKNKSVLG